MDGLQFARFTMWMFVVMAKTGHYLGFMSGAWNLTGSCSVSFLESAKSVKTSATGLVK